MKINLIKATAIIGLIGIIAGLFSDCKKIDLVRIAAVKTDPVTIIYTDAATVYGNIIDLGEDDNIEDFGFCWSTSNISPPTINNESLSLGSTNLPGIFSATITDLLSNTEYYVRSFIEDGNGIFYGNVVSFKTPPGVPTVTTTSISDITSTTATGGGSVQSEGGSSVSARGVCWSNSSSMPNIDNSHTSDGTGPGSFESHITGLNPNTLYFVRAYATNSNGTGYGVQTSFTSDSGGTGYWLHFDDGTNYTGIGLSDGSNFDYAIRFTTQALTNYNGFRISKIRFFPTATAHFYFEVYEGPNPPNFVFYEDMPNPIIDSWFEFTPTHQYFINSSISLWIGIWVTNYIAGTYPAGADPGPASPMLGDLISDDGGTTWSSLYYSNNSLNYNWNLQVYVTNQKGEEFLLTNEIPAESKVKPVTETGVSDSKPASEIENLNY